MTALNTVALGALAVVVVAGSSRAASVTSWNWTVWSPATGVRPTTVSTTAIPVASTPAPIVTPVAAVPSPAGNSWATAAPVAVPAAASMAPVASADAYLNMGTGPYPSASSLTTGGALPWFDSPVVTKLFNGTPDVQQRLDFTNTVFQHVEQTYQQSGVPLQLTTDPNVLVAHTVSVVSGTSYAPNPGAVGITNEGQNGFDFIDKFSGAQTVDQLEWLVAHNVAHELMHAFGGDHHDQTGNFLDAATTSWSTMINPNAVFSQASVAELLSKNFRLGIGSTDGSGAQMVADGQMVGPNAVPEPTTLLAWGLVTTAVALGHWRRYRPAA